ncbi:YtxH domain-containing protein [Alkalicoccus halolimnae]|uniref:YtxH domain-containing protein n=1 Tax=Alkalicoccus halolimnae TaxID=1667239 RepID=A0A5C7FBS4_9BACI|nr:YtxH domain-containing protein [Alkalicoccus halolimnae]TXF86890.1 YtxH domain-containing protein [Alkalicoccus halolimnae]
MAETQQSKASTKLVTGMAVGALVGAAVVMFDSNTRTKVVDNAGSLKDSTMKKAGEIREDPGGTKDQVMERVQSATTILKEAVNDLQGLYNKANSEVFEQVNEVKEDAEKIISSAKEAGSDLEDVGEKVMDAKEELVSDSSENSQEDNQTGGNDTTGRPV